jgi:hypothetical protein
MQDIRRNFLIVFVVFLMIAFGFTVGCTSPANSSPSPRETVVEYGTSAFSTVERVEVYHFHGNHQCTSCIAVGDLAEKTVNANFKDELSSGRLVFAHINAELPENLALAKKYEVTGSSLWIGVYDNNGFHKEQDIRVWYLIDDEDAYMTYLSDIISNRLNGNFS